MLLISRRRNLPESGIALSQLLQALTDRDLLGRCEQGLCIILMVGSEQLCPAHFPVVATLCVRFCLPSLGDCSPP